MMDHSFGVDRPYQPLPPEFAAIGARIVSSLHAGARTGVLVGPPGSGKTHVLDAVVAGMPGRVMRVSNRQPTLLTMGRLLMQLGAADVDAVAADDGRALLAHLAPYAGETEAAVLVVDDAHTLSPPALSALARVPGLGGPDVPGMILLLAGEDELLMRLGPLRDARTTVVLSMAEGPNLVRKPELEAEADPPPVPVMRSGFHVAAVLAAIVAGAAAFGVGLWLALWPLDRPAEPSTASSAAAPTPAVLEARGAPEPMDTTPLAASLSTPEPSEAQMRQDFEAFLSRSADTAHLAPGAREGLFREYLTWRARTAPRGG